MDYQQKEKAIENETELEVEAEIEREEEKENANENDKKYIRKTKEEKKMAVLAKPSKNLVVIDAKSSKDFLKRFNKNTISPSMIDSCAKAARLFGENGKGKKS